jgi:hypothetical protein
LSSSGTTFEKALDAYRRAGGPTGLFLSIMGFDGAELEEVTRRYCGGVRRSAGETDDDLRRRALAGWKPD